MNNVQITNIPIGSIKPYWRNPRKNAATVDALKGSILKYGFNVPLVLDKNFVIITGHARYKALTQLGWTDIPCVISDMSEQDAKEYRIADNKTSEISTWDKAQLEFELREIGNTDFLKVFFADTSFLDDFAFGGQNEVPKTYQPPQSYPPQMNNAVYNNERIIEESSQPTNVPPTPDSSELNSEKPLNNVKSIPQSMEVFNSNDVDSAKNKLENRIVEIDKRKQELMIPLICPCCMENFNISFADIEGIYKRHIAQL